MLQVDLYDSDYRIARTVGEVCGRFGRVSMVRVHRKPHAFALVDMASREQALELSFRFGGSTFGNCALVHLQTLLEAA